jgi:L-threonylcarbamoyladenylate synthase
MLRLDARGEGLEAALAEACRVVAGGGVVIFPTDTVYGIGCQPSHPAAVERIYALKGRPREKPLALHFSSVEYMLEYAPRDARVLALARRFLPGPLTIVVRRPVTVDASIVAGLPTLGLRVPEHATCAALLARCGPPRRARISATRPPSPDASRPTTCLRPICSSMRGPRRSASPRRSSTFRKATSV